MHTVGGVGLWGGVSRCCKVTVIKSWLREKVCASEVRMSFPPCLQKSFSTPFAFEIIPEREKEEGKKSLIPRQILGLRL